MKKGMDPRSKVNFDVEGKTYTLHYTTNAFVEFEDETGQSVLDVLGREDISLKGAIAASLPQEGGDEEPGKKPKAA